MSGFVGKGCLKPTLLMISFGLFIIIGSMSACEHMAATLNGSAVMSTDEPVSIDDTKSEEKNDEGSTKL